MTLMAFNLSHVGDDLASKGVSNAFLWSGLVLGTSIGVLTSMEVYNMSMLGDQGILKVLGRLQTPIRIIPRFGMDY